MTQKTISSFKFVALVAFLTALIGLSLDTMTPALGIISEHFGLGDSNGRQFVITSFFAGMTVGFMFYGPLSDSFGRKPIMCLGLCIYIMGTLLCLNATSFGVLLIGRTLQGFGAAGPRIISIAMVRDGHSGAAMARIMSFAMTLFMLVPILAPSLGQIILFFFDWSMIFWLLLLMSFFVSLWFIVCQPETLPREKRLPFSLNAMLSATGEVLTNKTTLGYTLAGGILAGALIVYLIAAQQIIQDQYHQGVMFPLWFGLIGLAFAASNLLNASLVMRLGMKKLSHWALISACVISFSFVGIAVYFQGQPPFVSLIMFLFLYFLCCSSVYGNAAAIAMEPMGRVAGYASSLTNTLSSGIALLLGALIGHVYDGTVTPIIGGFCLVSFFAYLCAILADRN